MQVNAGKSQVVSERSCTATAVEPSLKWVIVFVTSCLGVEAIFVQSGEDVSCC